MKYELCPDRQPIRRSSYSGAQTVYHVLIFFKGGGSAYVNQDLFDSLGVDAMLDPDWYRGSPKREHKVVRTAIES